MSSEEAEIARLQDARALNKAAAQNAGAVSLGGRAMDTDVYGGSKRSDYLTELPAGNDMEVDDDESTEDQPQRLLDSCELP